MGRQVVDFVSDLRHSTKICVRSDTNVSDLSQFAYPIVTRILKSCFFLVLFVLCIQSWVQEFTQKIWEKNVYLDARYDSLKLQRPNKMGGWHINGFPPGASVKHEFNCWKSWLNQNKWFQLFSLCLCTIFQGKLKTGITVSRLSPKKWSHMAKFFEDVDISLLMFNDHIQSNSGVVPTAQVEIWSFLVCVRSDTQANFIEKIKISRNSCICVFFLQKNVLNRIILHITNLISLISDFHFK